MQIDQGVKAELKELTQLAPLHNTAALEIIAATEKLLPGVPAVAAFDTAFHHTLSPAAYLYPVPYQWYKEWGIRRFGFHGLSYSYCCQRAAQLLPQAAKPVKLVACHLGSGCSLAAIDGNRSVATTMGFTPLDGLMMATRSGAIDPSIVLYLLANDKLSPAEIDNALNHASSLKGIYGSGDFQKVLAGKARGEELAQLAFEMFVSRLCQEIARMVAALEGLNALIFTAGIGENSPELRQAVVSRLRWLGLELDQTGNTTARGDRDIATASSKARILVIKTREELVVAEQTRQLLTAKI